MGSCEGIFSQTGSKGLPEDRVKAALISPMQKKMILNAEKNGDLDSIVGKTFYNHDGVRMVPDILKGGDEFYFPVFTSEEEMGEYGERFSKLQRHFLEAANLARNNEKKVAGIVINAFTEPFTVPGEILDVIAKMQSRIEKEQGMGEVQ